LQYNIGTLKVVERDEIAFRVFSYEPVFSPDLERTVDRVRVQRTLSRKPAAPKKGAVVKLLVVKAGALGFALTSLGALPDRLNTRCAGADGHRIAGGIRVAARETLVLLVLGAVLDLDNSKILHKQ
jgi:hypothetical protein